MLNAMRAAMESIKNKMVLQLWNVSIVLLENRSHLNRRCVQFVKLESTKIKQKQHLLRAAIVLMDVTSLTIERHRDSMTMKSIVCFV